MNLTGGNLLNYCARRVDKILIGATWGVGVHYIALHLPSYYRETYGYRVGDFLNTGWNRSGQDHRKQIDSIRKGKTSNTCEMNKNS